MEKSRSLTNDEVIFLQEMLMDELEKIGLGLWIGCGFLSKSVESIRVFPLDSLKSSEIVWEKHWQESNPETVFDFMEECFLEILTVYKTFKPHGVT